MEAEIQHRVMQYGGGREAGEADMESITTTLRQAREHKGVSLQDAEGKTRIPLKYLQALEGEGESGLLADEMYLIPFLRSYANFLGVDANQAVSRFLTELQRQDAAIVAPPERRPAMVQPRSGPSRLASWVAPFLLLLVALLVGSYLWQQGYLPDLLSYWQSRPPQEQTTSVATAQSPSTPPVAIVPPESSVAVVNSESPVPVAVVTSEPPVAVVSPAPTTSGSGIPSGGTATTVQSSQESTTTAGTTSTSPVAVVPQPTPSATQTTETAASSAVATSTPAAPLPVVAAPTPTTPTAVGNRHLRVQATSPTWIRVVADSRPGQEMILKAGESREWAADSSFTVSLGNAGGVTLNLDGQDLPPAGKAGQVVRNMRLPAAQ